MEKEKLAFTFSLEKNELKVFFSGRFDELMNGEELASLINKESQKYDPKIPLILHFVRVRAGNSLGIVQLLEMFKHLPMEKYIEGVPLWMVWQLNMLYELIHEFKNIRSFEAPFLNRKTHLGKILILHLGKEVPLLSDYSTWQCPSFEHEGDLYDPNFDESYLHFLKYYQRNSSPL